MIFVDSWAWIALAVERDQHHAAAEAQHRLFHRARRRYLTTNFVLGETITYLFSVMPADQAGAFIDSLLTSFDAGIHRLVDVSASEFRIAWQMRLQYHDKPDISFVDFTSMAVMQDLGITEVFTGDAHFRQVGLGFQLRP